MCGTARACKSMKYLAQIAEEIMENDDITKKKRT